jgi:hypothetical protein
MERESGTDSVIAVLFFVVAVAAMAEVVAGRSVMAEAPHGTTWQVLLQTGHDAHARGDLPSARRAYLTALFRARGERSLFGVLSAAEGFKSLGDGEVVEQALAMAAGLGPEDDAPTRLQALRDRLAATDALPMALHATH